MKRLLVLMLVLGFASMATANLALWINGAPADSSSIDVIVGETVYIELYNDGTVDKSIGYMSIAAGPGSWTGSYNIYNPPATGSATTYAYYYPVPHWTGDAWILYNADANPANLNGIGILADWEFECDALGDVTITYTDSVLGLQDTLVIHQIIPEPMTIVLLGLGGLFLRRRK